MRVAGRTSEPQEAVTVLPSSSESSAPLLSWAVPGAAVECYSGGGEWFPGKVVATGREDAQVRNAAGKTLSFKLRNLRPLAETCPGEPRALAAPPTGKRLHGRGSRKHGSAGIMPSMPDSNIIPWPRPSPRQPVVR